jgi:hypothetical protein
VEVLECCDVWRPGRARWLVLEGHVSAIPAGFWNCGGPWCACVGRAPVTRALLLWPAGITAPNHLSGDLAGDRGFDPLNLCVRPQRLHLALRAGCGSLSGCCPAEVSVCAVPRSAAKLMSYHRCWLSDPCTSPCVLQGH